MTTDILVTYPTASGHKIMAYQVKDTVAAAAVRDKRTQTKLVIELRYWKTKKVETVAVVSEHFNPIFTDNLQLLALFRNTVCTPEDLNFWHDALLARAARSPAMALGELLKEQLPPLPGIGLADNELNALKMLVGH